MIIAIYELNGKKLKTTNLTKKLKKLKQTPTILFQQEFEGSIKEAESILDEQLKEEEVVDYLPVLERVEAFMEDNGIEE